MYMSHGNSECLLGLVSLGIGYIVLAKAIKETKGLRLLGIIVATTVLASTLLLGAGKLLYCLNNKQGYIMGPKASMSTKSFCPIMPEGSK